MARRTEDTFVYLQPLEGENNGLLVLVIHRESPLEAPSAMDMFVVCGWDRAAVTSLLFEQYDELRKSLFDQRQVKYDKDRPIGWVTAYILSKLDAFVSIGGRRVWLEVMREAINRLGCELMEPLAERLRQIGAKRVVLMPGDRLGLLPLHAMPIDEKGSPFCEEFETRYAPSVTALAQCSGGNPMETSELRLVGIANPDGSLIFSDMQMRAVSRIFESHALIKHGSAACRKWLLAQAPVGDLIALSTHAVFLRGQPENSYFVLAHTNGIPKSEWANRAEFEGTSKTGEKLTLGDLWRGEMRMKAGAIIVADACETGLFEPNEIADEFLGFPAGFLASGAATVVASLWSVNDFSTALLMETFYNRIKEGDPPAKAMQHASLQLRKLTRDEISARLERELKSLDQEFEVCEKRLGASYRSRLDVEEYILLRRSANALHGALKRIASGAEYPFAHPFHWAGFAVNGASLAREERR